MSQPVEIVFEGHVSPDYTRRYLDVPIEIPSHMTRININYTYSLGFYKAWHNGCDYRVIVRLKVDESAAGYTGEFLPLLPPPDDHLPPTAGRKAKCTVTAATAMATATRSKSRIWPSSVAWIF